MDAAVTSTGGTGGRPTGTAGSSGAGGTGGSSGLAGSAGTRDAGAAGGSGGTGGSRDAAIDQPPRDAAAAMDRPIEAPPRDAAPDVFRREASADVNMMMADTACMSYAQAYCNVRKTCTSGFVIDRDHGSDANCLANVKADCVRGLYYPWTGETIARFMACTTALQAQAQNCNDYFLGVEPPSCVDLPGSIENGGVCLSSRQCASGYCPVPSNQLCGVCEPGAMEGGACTNDDQCAPGIVCAMGICTKPAAMGAACNATTKPCGAGLTCVGDTAAIDGACQRRLTTEGAECDTTTATKPDCESRLGLYCHVPVPAMPDAGAGDDAGSDAGATDAGATDAGATDAGATDAGVTTIGKCAKITLAGVGQVCGRPADGTSIVCRAGATCSRPYTDASASRPATGTCVADVGANMPCNTSSNMGPGCTVGLRCVTTMAGGSSGTCQTRIYSACPMM